MRHFTLSAAASAFAAIATFSATPLAAAPWAIDKSHTSVIFQVDHLGFSIVNGFFREFDATVDFDPENMETASVDFTIKADSVDTNWKRATNISAARISSMWRRTRRSNSSRKPCA